jgi:cold shock CspA family protein
VLLHVHRYLPERLYGFCSAPDGGQVFFHLSAFQPGASDVPPIIGERVEVVLPENVTLPTSPAPRAVTVTRLDTPRRLEGVVCNFLTERGWGFVRTTEGSEVFLHRSEVLGGRLPTNDMRVWFYMGVRDGKPRACHVEVP